MKKTTDQMFSNGTEYMQWTYRNCSRCIKRIKDPNGVKFRCSVERDIYHAALGIGEVNLRSYNATQQRVCPYLKTERTPTKKRKVKGQGDLF